MSKGETQKDYLVMNQNRIQFLMSVNTNRSLFKEGTVL